MTESIPFITEFMRDDKMKIVDAPVLRTNCEELYIAIDSHGVPVNDIGSKLFARFPSLKEAIPRTRLELGTVIPFHDWYEQKTLSLVVSLYDESRGDNVHHLTETAVRLHRHFLGMEADKHIALSSLVTEPFKSSVEDGILMGIFKDLPINIDFHKE